MPVSHANCDLPQEHERENVEGIECYEGCAQLESIHSSHTTLCSERKNVFAAFLFSLKSVKKTFPLCEENQNPVLYSLHLFFFLKCLTSAVFALIILFLRFLENKKREPIFFSQYTLCDFFFSSFREDIVRLRLSLAPFSFHLYFLSLLFSAVHRNAFR